MKVEFFRFCEYESPDKEHCIEFVREIYEDRR